MSFGCPNCDAIVGNYYFYESYIECINEISEDLVTIKSADYVGRTTPSVAAPRYEHMPKTRQSYNVTITPAKPSFYRFVYPTFSGRPYISIGNVVEGQKTDEVSSVELDIICNNIDRTQAEKVGIAYLLKHNLMKSKCLVCAKGKSEECDGIKDWIYENCANYIEDKACLEYYYKLLENVKINRIV